MRLILARILVNILLGLTLPLPAFGNVMPWPYFFTFAYQFGAQVTSCEAPKTWLIQTGHTPPTNEHIRVDG